MVERVERAAGGIETVGDGVTGKRGIVLLAREALLLRRRKHPAVFNQRRGTVVIERRDAEDAHQKR